jgi:hypothetical protein
MLSVSRRKALLAASALSVVAVSACDVVTSNTVNGVTTVTVNVAQATADLSGLAAAAAICFLLPGVGTALTAIVGPAVVAAIPLVIAKINAAIPALQQAAGASQKFSFDTKSVPAFITALISDAETIATDASTVITHVGSATVAKDVTEYAAAVQSLANAIIAMFGPTTAAAARAKATPSGMSVKDALALVGIKQP